MRHRQAAIVGQRRQAGIDRENAVADQVATVIGDDCAGVIANEAEAGHDIALNIIASAATNIASDNRVIDRVCAVAGEEVQAAAAEAGCIPGDGAVIKVEVVTAKSSHPNTTARAARRVAGNRGIADEHRFDLGRFA